MTYFNLCDNSFIIKKLHIRYSQYTHQKHQLIKYLLCLEYIWPCF